MNKVNRIIFVCTGNTCRSPMAEGLFRRMLEARGVTGVTVESAGLAAVTGLPPSDNAVDAAGRLGADIYANRSRQLSQYMADEADLIVCMTQSHLDALLRILPDEKLRVLGEGISDPYGGDAETYAQCAEEIRRCLCALADELYPKNGEN